MERDTCDNSRLTSQAEITFKPSISAEPLLTHACVSSVGEHLIFCTTRTQLNHQGCATTALLLASFPIEFEGNMSNERFCVGFRHQHIAGVLNALICIISHVFKPSLWSSLHLTFKICLEMQMKTRSRRSRSFHATNQKALQGRDRRQSGWTPGSMSHHTVNAFLRREGHLPTLLN